MRCYQSKNHKKNYLLYYISLTLFIISCNIEPEQEETSLIHQSSNALNYSGTPSSPTDRSSLAFSDQGAWFAYGFLAKENKSLGFTGPFLMTQGQGEWSSKILSELTLLIPLQKRKFD